ncbi:hypothetical protein FGO68_gene16552 [Halteria grandinella]|uniref:Uncharacterized protein n=1 Tax=Halteria grandinella TaxID=5974 RepID=A0A8J8T058_HALGN|nr:hypothetical protein FGO68_gene16552 [Halteria grandinella]
MEAYNNHYLKIRIQKMSSELTTREFAVLSWSTEDLKEPEPPHRRLLLRQAIQKFDPDIILIQGNANTDDLVGFTTHRSERRGYRPALSNLSTLVKVGLLCERTPTHLTSGQNIPLSPNTHKRPQQGKKAEKRNCQTRTASDRPGGKFFHRTSEHRDSPKSHVISMTTDSPWNIPDNISLHPDQIHTYHYQLHSRPPDDIYIYHSYILDSL